MEQHAAITCTYMGFLSGDDENDLKLTVVMDTQLCEYTKSHWIVYFNCLNCMVYELYLNKTVKEKNGRRNKLPRATMADLIKGKGFIRDHRRCFCVIVSSLAVCVCMCSYACFRVFWSWPGPRQNCHIGKVFPQHFSNSPSAWKWKRFNLLSLEVVFAFLLGISQFWMNEFLRKEPQGSFQAEVSGSGMESGGLLLGWKLA